MFYGFFHGVIFCRLDFGERNNYDRLCECKKVYLSTNFLFFVYLKYRISKICTVRLEKLFIFSFLTYDLQ